MKSSLEQNPHNPHIVRGAAVAPVADMAAAAAAADMAAGSVEAGGQVAAGFWRRVMKCRNRLRLEQTETSRENTI